MHTLFDSSGIDTWSRTGLAVLLDMTIKGTLVLVVAALLCLLLRRASAATRHLLLCVALGQMALLPLLAVALPVWQLPILLPSELAFLQTVHRPLALTPEGVAPSGPAVFPAQPGALAPTTRSEAVPTAPPAEGQEARPLSPGAELLAANTILPPGWRWLVLLWVVGALLVVAPLLVGAVSLRRIARASPAPAEATWTALLHALVAELGLRRPVSLRESARVSVPMTWGLWHPLVLLPVEAADWSPERRRLVLLHELAHVQRLDCLTQLLAHTACALYWYHPLVWLAARQMRIERERACDDRVLVGGVKASAYAEHLLEIARLARRASCATLAGVPMARPSQLEGRLLAMLDTKRSRWAVSRLAVLVAITVGCASALPLAGLEAAAREGQGDVMVTQELGARLRPSREMTAGRVWGGPVVDATGAPSPDGRYLSFTDWETGDLAIRDLSTGKNRRLTNKGSWATSPEFVESSRFSPDGKQVAYAWMNRSNTFYELRLIGLNGSRPRVLYHHPDVQWVLPADWSRDGKQILTLFWKKSEILEIALVSAIDGSARPLKTLEWRSPGKISIKMALSPDGRTIAYDFPAQAGARERDLFLLATDGGDAIPLVRHPADDFVIGWAPDGQSLLFASDRTGSLGAWSVRIAGRRAQGSPALVKREIGAMSPLGLTRNGSLYYGLRAGLMDVYTATLDPATGQLLTLPEPVNPRQVGSNSSPAWSPDGRYLAYRSPERSAMLHDAESHIVSVRSVETGETRELPLNLEFIYETLSWSPGPFLIAHGKDREGHELFRIDAQTGAAAGIPKAFGPMWHAVYAPDGKAVFSMKGSEERGFTLCAWDLETGQEQDLYRASSEFGNLALSHDGRQLAFSEADRGTRASVLKVLPAAGGQPRELLRIERPESIKSVAWMPDGRHLLYARGNWRSTDPRKQATEVWRIPVAGGVPGRVGLAMSRLRDLRVHRDGRRIAFSAGSPEIEIWVMENLFSAAQREQARGPRR